LRSTPRSALRADPLSETTHDAALEYLARSPFLNVFLSHVLLHDLPATVRRNVVVVLDGTSIVGVGYFGRQIVLAADPPAVAPLAAHALRHRGTRMIIGPRETIAAFWELVGSKHGRPRLVRERQLVMALDRNHLKRGNRRITVRHASMDEWRAVADGSASMIAQELEYNPRRDSPGFDSGVRTMIERKLWWVGVAEGRLCFFCNLGPWSDQTVQLQGIWTPLEMRGQGLATAALATICDRLLAVSPTLSLYVNDFNDAAIALYRRVGFTQAGEFTTILF
jgi:uncharacterized protein